ncbi:MAG: 1-deoxy-D-xylulose-5-phosphate reductoisomerase [Phycisphaerales bacterium]|nr:1-deoxy-D-xylulose-5-phosphate reductoisomerase [Phycisphaerales bacterium]
MHVPVPTTRRLIVLGSTGSIGVNTLDVARHLQTSGLMDLKVVGLAGGRNADLLIKQALEHQVPAVAVADVHAAEVVQNALPGVHVYRGPDAAKELVESIQATDLSAAIVGSAGLEATLAGVRKGMRIGLANKETLVAAGALVTPEVRRCGATLIPVDSEHSAIFQCLAGMEESGPMAQLPSGRLKETTNSKIEIRNSNFTSAIKRIVLTASGGPFRNTPIQEMNRATVEQALAHPTWKMGAKISIDSATMMNKALEIIEAHWLFDLPADQIAVIIHPQSVAHSFVEFADNSVLAQLGPPDMRTPIQYALTYPQRMDGCSRAMDWAAMSHLEFFQPDFDKFPALRLAYDVIEAGGTAGAVFNAANEAAVAAFLEQRIRFGRIVELVSETLAALTIRPLDSLQTVLEADAQAREFVQQRLGSDPH